MNFILGIHKMRTWKPLDLGGFEGHWVSGVLALWEKFHSQKTPQCSYIKSFKKNMHRTSKVLFHSLIVPWRLHKCSSHLKSWSREYRFKKKNWSCCLQSALEQSLELSCSCYTPARQQIGANRYTLGGWMHIAKSMLSSNLPVSPTLSSLCLE